MIYKAPHDLLSWFPSVISCHKICWASVLMFDNFTVPWMLHSNDCCCCLLVLLWIWEFLPPSRGHWLCNCCKVWDVPLNGVFLALISVYLWSLPPEEWDPTDWLCVSISVSVYLQRGKLLANVAAHCWAQVKHISQLNVEELPVISSVCPGDVFDLLFLLLVVWRKKLIIKKKTQVHSWIIPRLPSCTLDHNSLFSYKWW